MTTPKYKIRNFLEEYGVSRVTPTKAKGKPVDLNSLKGYSPAGGEISPVSDTGTIQSGMYSGQPVSLLPSSNIAEHPFVTNPNRPSIEDEYAPIVQKGQTTARRNNLLKGITYEEFSKWGYDSEDSLREAGIVKGNEVIDINKYHGETGQPYPDSILKIAPKTRPLSEYESIVMGTGGGNPLTGLLNIPSINIAGVDLSPGDIINIGILAYGGAKAIQTGGAIFNRQIAKNALKRWATNKGINTKSLNLDLSVDVMERNLTPQQMRKAVTGELKTMLAGQRGSGSLVPMSGANEPIKPQLAKQAQQAGQIISGAWAGLVGKLSGETTGIKAIWRAKDADRPVTITGIAGEMNGVKYYSIEGSKAAIPESELTIEKVTQPSTQPIIQHTLESYQKTASPATPQSTPVAQQPIAGETPVVQPPTSVTPELSGVAMPPANVPPSLPPMTQPPVPPAQPPVSNVPAPSGKGIEFGDLQSADTVAGYTFKPDISRSVANLPIIKQALKTLNPSAVASTPAEKGVVIRAVLRDEAKAKAQPVIAYLNRLGSQEKIFGKLGKNGLIASGKLNGKAINDIRQYPGKYDLTKEQKAWVKAADDIERAKLKYLKENDIEVRELSFEEGGQYAGRRVYAKMTADGELLDTAFIGAGPSRVGAKASFEKVRTFKTVDEAAKAGYRYLPDDEALALNVQAAYNKVADKRFVEWTLNKIPWRSTGAPDELVIAAEAARLRYRKAQQLVAAVNRAYRGERVPESTLKSVELFYPEPARLLRELISNVQAGKKADIKTLREFAKTILDVEQRETLKAVSARARAREAALRTKYDESSIFHPSFQGKIFTGEEAKKTAETLRNALEPKLNSAIETANKFNAVARYFKLAGDMSTFGIQLLFLAGQNPIIYGKAFAGSINAIFSPEFQSKYLLNKKPVIDRHPGLIISKSGTEFTEALARGGFLRQGVMKLAGNVLTPFQRGFEAALDFAGIEMAESLEHLAKTPEQIAEVDQFINEFRGLTSTAKLGVTPAWRSVETAVMLAPRYNRAIAALLYDAVKGTLGIGQAGLRGRLARNGLARGIMAIIAIFIAIGFALGKDWDEIQESLDPRSSKFLTYNLDGTNIGPGTKIRSLVKTIAEAFENPSELFKLSMDNPFVRFARGNMSPILSSGIDILTGRTYIGDPVRDNWQSFLKEEVMTQFIPIWLENVIMEGGDIGQRIIRGSGEFFGGRTYPETTNDVVKNLKERYAAQDYGKTYDDLTQAEKDKMLKAHEDLVEAVSLNEKYWTERGDNLEQNTNAIEKQLIDQRNNSLNKAAQAYKSEKISKYDYDKERSRIRPYYSGGMEVLYALREMEKSESEIKSYQKYLDARKPEDKALDEYFKYYGDLLEQSDLPIDFDVVTVELQKFLEKYDPAIQKYIMENKDAWIQDLPEPARSLELERLAGIEDETWWDNYRGNQATPNSFTPYRPKGW